MGWGWCVSEVPFGLEIWSQARLIRQQDAYAHTGNGGAVDFSGERPAGLRLDEASCRLIFPNSAPGFAF
jgi:hypothetical protein